MLKILSLMILCLLAGCNTTSDQRIELLQEAVQQAEASAGQLDVYIVDLQTAIAEAKLLMQDPALSVEQKEEVLKFLTETDDALVAAVAKKDAVLESLTDFKSSIVLLQEQGSGIGTELQILGEGIKAASAALPPPGNGYGILVGTILTIVGGVFGRKQGLRSADKTVYICG